MIRPLLQLLTIFGMFIGGGLLGWALSFWAAPGSGLGMAVSGLGLPLAFCTGLVVWTGLDLVSAVVDRIRGRAITSSGSTLANRAVWWFVPVCVAFTCAEGLFVGLVPGGKGPFTSTLVYGAVGAAYGFAAGWLAARGYLPAPHTG